VFKITRMVLVIAAMVIGSTTFSLAATSATPAKTVAQTSPAPKPTATPNPFSYRGYVRAYDFTRQNAYNGGAFGGTGKLNQQSFNAALNLHADYALGQGWSIGGSYLYANPLNGCTTAASHFTEPCGNIPFNKASTGGQQLNPDDTLPGFQLSTLYEAYVKYAGNGLKLAGGNLNGSLPWAPASDSRVKPVAYQGVDGTYQINKQWAIQAADYWQWECRTCSTFDHGTLLTTVTPFGAIPQPDGTITKAGVLGYAGATALAANIFDPTYSTLTNQGVAFGRIGYTGPKTAPLTANLSYYGFSNIAGAIWLDAKYPFAGKLKPFVAIQAGGESNTGSALIGKISSSVFGIQAGFNPLPNITLQASYDTVPVKTDNVVLPAGFACNATHQITSPAVVGSAIGGYGGNLPYALPQGGTAQCSAGAAAGTTDIYYGGWLSPYTDSYATDPFFTTSMIQGQVDRRSPGNSAKVQATFTSDDKRFVTYITQAWYNYANPGYATATLETNYDAQYFFSKLPKTGSYKGFVVRYRYGSREGSPTNFAGPVGLFKYNRFQAEYDF
jgi:hypothetical protein